MNYSTGKKIVIASFAVGIFTSLLTFVLISFISNIETLNFFSTITTLLSNVIPTATALGFAIMYSYSNNKYNLALAIAAVFPFFSTLLAYVLPYTVLGSSIYITVDACMYAILPLAWALKWKSRAPLFSIVFALIAMWLATSPILYTLPAVENGMLISFSLLVTIANVISYAISGVYIVSALLEKD